jgi:hypothetical protein
MNTIVSVLIRHFLAAVGVSGVVSQDEVQQIVGAIVTLAMIAWSIWSKREQIKTGT